MLLYFVLKANKTKLTHDSLCSHNNTTQLCLTYQFSDGTEWPGVAGGIGVEILGIKLCVREKEKTSSYFCLLFFWDNKGRWWKCSTSQKFEQTIPCTVLFSTLFTHCQVIKHAVWISMCYISIKILAKGKNAKYHITTPKTSCSDLMNFLLL